MRIIAVRGKNLASLGGEFEIDFTSEPLKSAGIFAITGNTGSGKSTILDALCLALYDSTPRMNKAKESNVLLKDVNDKTITQYDSRSILRRGSSDGYAQVDFVAITGENFRSTWSVRRAGNKPTGALQKVEMSVVNLLSGEQVQGTKTEIQSRLIQLVGLSFEQFSRSVLLAQGDFATFMKAKQGEKAEILEKLTGTEIYSAISTSIYTKAKEIDNKKKELLQHIQDVELIDDEQREKLLLEDKENRQNLIVECKEEEDCRKTIKWIEDYELLKKNLDSANVQAKKLEEEKKNASERYQQMQLIDSAQTVRNLYVELTLAKKQMDDDMRLFESEKRILATEESEMKMAVAEKLKCNEQEIQFNKYIESIQPQIEEAKKLDIQIEEQTKQCEVIDKEYNALLKQLKENCDTIKSESDKLSTLNEEKKSFDKWFEHYEGYSSLVPAKELVVNLLSNYYNAIEQIKLVNKTLCDVKKSSEAYDKSLADARKEAERLDGLHPSEIVILRKKLQDGKPCPVCGSIHHPLMNEWQDVSIKEDELEALKKRNVEDIERYSTALERLQQESIRLKASIENYERERNESLAKVKGYVCILPSWERLLDEGKLKVSVENFIYQWNTKSDQRISNREKCTAVQAGLDGMKREMSTFEKQVDEKKKRDELCKGELQRLKDGRKNILEGKSIDVLTDEITKQRATIERTSEAVIAKEHKASLRVESAKTKIGQIGTQIEKEKSTQIIAQDKIDKWLSQQDRIADMHQLEMILSIDEEWISSEKRYLSSLNEKYAASMAVLKEREGKKRVHEDLTDRPTENVTDESIKEKLSAVLSKKNEINRILAQIELSFENDKINRKKVESYKKEFDGMSDLFQAWSSLNDLFGSMSGNKFKEIAQEYTLDILVMYANAHLKDLAPRYQLERIQDTLALQIVDIDMMCERRSVHSLSGGESFLVSLALALGLSSISSNRMNVESLFIDEGFGSLDMETLRVAMDALECLQMQGRKIGVISHVSEMTERISTRIQVIKEGNGRSVIKVV